MVVKGLAPGLFEAHAVLFADTGDECRHLPGCRVRTLYILDDTCAPPGPPAQAG